MLCTALGRGPCAGLLGAAQTGQPGEDVLHHAGIQGIINILAALFIADKACGLQHREVVRYGRRVGSPRALNVASNSMPHTFLPQFDGFLNISIAQAASARKHAVKKYTKNTKKGP